MFVALRPPETAVEDLDEFLAVRRDAAGFRWTPADHLHVTLAFLAAVPDRALDDLHERLARAAARRHGVTVRIAGGGAFPHVAGARVLWAGLHGEPPAQEELRRLATGVRAAAGKAGIAVDGQRFRPHLTVARLGRPTEVTSWVRLLDAYSGPVFETSAVELVASHLGEGPRGRPRHERVATFPLARPGRASSEPPPLMERGGCVP